MKHPMQCAKCFRVCRLSDSGKTWVCTICKHREKANGGQAVSDTPRTDSRLTAILDSDGFTHNGNCPQRWVNHARELERELNRMADRINKLEEAGDKMADLLDGGVFMKLAVQWHEAKEDKP